MAIASNESAPKMKMTTEQIKEFWLQDFKEAQNVLSQFMNNADLMQKCALFSQTLIQAYLNEKTVFSCGNGGSHCDAMHFAEEMTGRYRKDRRPLPAMALADAPHTTCVSNDYGFEYIFSRPVEAFGKPGDVLIGLSTSGNSKNVIKAFEMAKTKGVKTVALLGRDGGALKSMADIAIIVPAQTSDRIQEMHIKLIHIVIEMVERELFPEHY